MKRKIISGLLIILGILIAAYPKTLQLYQTYNQEQLIEQWQESFRMIDYQEVSPRQQLEGLEDLELPLIEKELPPEGLAKNMDGIMKIEKIDLVLPILKGTTRQNLTKALASIDQTGRPGEIGNYAIAGHRNQAYGSMFNRLDEVERGDHIIIDSGQDRYDYTVQEKLLVKPEEIWVLESKDKDKEITLITCDPIIGATHRLIIKGKIVE